MMLRQWCIIRVGHSWRSAVLKMLKPVCLAPQSTLNNCKITPFPVCLLCKLTHSNTTHHLECAHNQETLSNIAARESTKQSLKQVSLLNAVMIKS